MLKWLIVSISSILLIASPLAAQESSYHLELENPPTLDASFKLIVNGVTGYWFPDAMARDVLADVQAYRAQTILVSQKDEQLEFRAMRIEVLQEALKLQQDVSVQAKGVVDEALRMQRRAEEEEDSLFAGKPGLWAAAGAALAGVLVAVLK